MAPPLIGLIGKKRAGKDTFAATLAGELGFVRVAFADPLRAAALRLDPLVGPCSLPGALVSAYHPLAEVVGAVGWEIAKDTVPGVREILQRLGTDAIRAIDADFWVRAGMAEVEAFRASGEPVAVTDCRFPNEAEAIAAAGGLLVRIVRPGPPVVDEHPTETALDGYPVDAVVDNDGSLEDLARSAVSVAQLWQCV